MWKIREKNKSRRENNKIGEETENNDYHCIQIYKDQYWRENKRPAESLLARKEAATNIELLFVFFLNNYAQFSVISLILMYQLYIFYKLNILPIWFIVENFVSKSVSLSKLIEVLGGIYLNYEPSNKINLKKNVYREGKVSEKTISKRKRGIIKMTKMKIRMSF